MENTNKGGYSKLRNRKPKDMDERKLGSSAEYCATVVKVDVSTISWKDRKIVHLEPSFAAEELKSAIRRCGRSTKTYIDTD